MERVNVLSILLFCGVFLSDADEIVQVVMINRHGDRAPLFTDVPKNHINWKEALRVEPGQITGLGLNQGYRLGKWLRDRYVNQFPLISPDYTASEVLVHSTDYDRTIMTAQAIQRGLFPDGSSHAAWNDLDDDWGIPAGWQPIPIHTQVVKNNVLQAVDICPTYNQMKKKLYVSDMWQRKEAEEKDFLWLFKSQTGIWWANLRHFYYMYDPILVQKTHNLQGLQFLEDRYEKIQELAAWTEWHKIHIGGKLIGGPLVRYILDHMEKRINCNGPNCAPRKFIQYSAHDSTLMSIYATLGYDDMDMFQRLPHFADAIIFELHKEKKGSFFVNVVHRDGVSGEVATVQERTPFVKWQTFAVSHSFPNLEQWCIACYNLGANSGAAGQCLRLLPNYLDQLHMENDEPDRNLGLPPWKHQSSNTTKRNPNTKKKKSIEALVPEKILKTVKN